MTATPKTTPWLEEMQRRRARGEELRAATPEEQSRQRATVRRFRQWATLRNLIQHYTVEARCETQGAATTLARLENQQKELDGDLRARGFDVDDWYAKQEAERQRWLAKSSAAVRQQAAE